MQEKKAVVLACVCESFRKPAERTVLRTTNCIACNAAPTVQLWAPSASWVQSKPVQTSYRTSFARRKPEPGAQFIPRLPTAISWCISAATWPANAARQQLPRAKHGQRVSAAAAALHAITKLPTKLSAVQWTIIISTTSIDWSTTCKSSIEIRHLAVG